MDDTKQALQQALDLAAAQLQQALQQEQDTKALKELTAVLKELTDLSGKLYAATGDEDAPEAAPQLQVLLQAGPDEWNS